MDEFVLFAFLLFTANISNSSACFLGESTARQSAFWFYPTFKQARQNATLKMGPSKNVPKMFCQSFGSNWKCLQTYRRR
jgi:hypothetical protein